ncbi:MAG: hypothetical protein JNG44_02410 [Porphyromonas sp.]|uniref:hypothetical protein n=1 Tax=Porphyromonas sp. TaxID=1924944 RepID=UPI001A40C640|nr:hypothetical protein [Porphyromonas sp.]MBL6452542.1 hypothetical protein [Porphyromonas sp.]
MKQKLQHHALIVTLVTMLLTLTSFSASAQYKYGLTIAGVEVTSANYKDLSNIPGVTGQVSYDPFTHTLTLTDATISARDSAGIVARVFLTCIVNGTVSVTAKDNSALIFYENATIKGSGTLVAKNESDVTILSKSTLIIDGCTIEAEGGEWAISGKDSALSPHTERLIIRYASVTLKSRSYTISDFESFALESCVIMNPTGAAWKTKKRALCDAAGNPITGEVVIRPTAWKYGLWIGDQEITSENYKNLNDIPGVIGQVSYDPFTHTLTLEDATIDTEKNHGIESETALTCIVKGNVSISSKNAAMCFYNNTTIKGDGQLSLKTSSSGWYAIVLVANASLLIDGCTIEAMSRRGISGTTGASSATLTIKHASVTLKPSELRYGAICNLASLTLLQSHITKPANAVWNDDKHAVCDTIRDEIITDELVITPIEEYNFWIGKERVTSVNCKDLSNIPGVKSGKVSYDPDTKTLTLEDATIEEPVILYSDLTCVVKGKVSITPPDGSAMYFGGDASIKGGGVLTIKSSQSFGIYMEDTLVIDGCTLLVEGKWGISGYDATHGEVLTIRNASVTAKGYEGSICNLADFKLQGKCEITKPAGAVWNAEKHAVCNAAGNVIKDTVVITPMGGTAIDFVTPEQLPAEGAVYDMNGVLRSEPLEELPTGVYIVGGQKVMHVQR